MIEDKTLRQRMAADLALSLGLERPPAFLSEHQLDQAGVRSKHCLQSDRANNKGIKYGKAGGLVRYGLSDVLDFLVAAQRNHTGDDRTDAQHAAAARNLQKAQARRHHV